jgi:uncharacterized CHY-type Zn-finger protein
VLSGAGLADAQVTTDRIAALTDAHGYFPCMDCHRDQETIAGPRILEEEHSEPMVWEDDDGVSHSVPFGQKVAIADLLGNNGTDTVGRDNLARIGLRLNIAAYVESRGLSPADSVWTLVHGGGNIWCLDCHDTVDRDKLVKINGDTLTFNQSHLLCGECHGPILRDWEWGIHGKTVGYWDPKLGGEQQTIRLLCVECHDSHRPAFRSMMPLAAPVTRVDGPGRRAHHETEAASEARAEESAH